MVSDIRAGDGNLANLFYSVDLKKYKIFLSIWSFQTLWMAAYLGPPLQLQQTGKIKYYFLNPFIPITPSKPLTSLRSWITLHNSEIYYPIILAEVTLYWYMGGGGGACCICQKIFFSGSLFILQPCPTILAEVTIYSSRFTTLFWFVSKPYYHYAF